MTLHHHVAPLFLLWGKKGSKFSLQQVDSHPLVFHMLDVAAVAEAFLQEDSKNNICLTLRTKLDGMKSEVAVAWLIFWVALHDIGKATVSFQKKWLDRYLLLKRIGLKSLGVSKKAPYHGVMTTAVLEPLLVSLGFDAFSARHLAVVIGGHHGRFPTNLEIQTARDLIESDRLPWQRVRQELFDILAKHFGVKELPVPILPRDNAFFVQLAAFISVTDWIGSIEQPGFFEYTEPNKPLGAYWCQVHGKAPAILEKLGWLSWSPPEEQTSIEALFPFIAEHGLRPVQESVVQLEDKLYHPGLVIVEAPMGQGKTEAAMFLSDHWAFRLRQSGTYFGLPTQATSNQMFGRIQEFLSQHYPLDQVNFQLMHGHASLSSEFEVLRKRDHYPPMPSIVEEEDSANGSVFAAEWFTYKKRGLLAPFGVGTVDQVILAVLQTKHYFVRLWGLERKTVIIDEIHAYDAYMLTHLKNLMSWLAALGSSVVLLSATLPYQRRKELMEAFEEGLGCTYDEQLEEAEYPRVTWVGRDKRLSLAVKPGMSCAIGLKWVDGRIPESPEEPFQLGKSLSEAMKHGGCTVIIVNTVDRAQHMYQALKAWFPESDAGDGYPVLDLFHARFRFLDRTVREQRVLKRFGKPNPDTCRPHRAVLVATQVVEQSLDLDFDLMISDLAPVDLILQRVGRLQRHDRQRPVGLSEAELWLIRPESVGDRPEFDAGTKAVYDPAILLKSWLLLRQRDALYLPQDMESMIEAVYGEGDHKAFEGFTDEILRLHGEYLAENQFKEFQALVKAIPSPHDSEFLEQPTEELFEDDPLTHPAISALTRLSGPSIELVVLWEGLDMPRLNPDGELVDITVRPDGQLTKELLRRSLRLSLAKVVKEFGEMKPPDGWARSAWLRNHRPLILNSNRKVAIGPHLITLDPELGLVVESTKEE